MSGGMSCESRELPSHEHFHRNLKEKSELPQSHTPQYSAAFLYGQTSGLLLYIYERRQTCRNGILLPDVYHHHFVFSDLYGANLPRNDHVLRIRISADFPWTFLQTTAQAAHIGMPPYLRGTQFFPLLPVWNKQQIHPSAYPLLQS